MDKKLLFSITKKDFDIQYYRGTGAGGQKRNKTSSACRIVHHPSGAIGTSQDSRSQTQNTEMAFKRLIESEAFKSWLRVEIGARMLGYSSIEEKIEDMIDEKNLKIEVQNELGEWVTPGD